DPQSTQLCLTNESMLEELTKNALKLLKNNPSAQFISISQNDNRNFCHCSQCLEVIQKESFTDLLLRVVNKVAEKIKKDYPSVNVITLAYYESEKPPKVVTPNRNVYVHFAPINGDFG